MRHVKKNWFLISLAAVLSVGAVAPQQFAGLAHAANVRYAIVTTVMFLMALTVETRVAWQTVRRPWAALTGTGVNILVVPCLAIAASRLLSGDLAVGVIVAASVPCTLASAAVWTRRAGGNDVTAILITLLTNATCFLWMPGWLVLGTRTHTEFDVGEMVSRLMGLVVLPMACAQVLRLMPHVASRADAHKATLGTLSQLGILSMVLIAAVNTRLTLGETQLRGQLSVARLVWMAVVVVAIHVTSLYIAYRLARGFGFPRVERIAVAFGGSQKTLMIGLHVAIEYFGGLAALPMLVYHIGQLLIDTVIADRWREFDEQDRAAGQGADVDILQSE